MIIVLRSKADTVTTFSSIVEAASFLQVPLMAFLARSFEHNGYKVTVIN